MKINSPIIRHPWDLNKDDAVRLQKELADKVVKYDHLNEVRYIAGVDAAYDELRHQQFAAAVVLDAASSFSIVEYTIAQESFRSAYVPGLFSFRELPTIIQALEKLKTVPDLIVPDGQGVAHPRRFGLASHLGVLFDIPTIGCSKTRLIGEAKEPGSKRGDYSPLIDRGEIIGRVLRTQDNVKPIYVSIGHLVSLQTACDWILKLACRYRLPETTRQADQIVRKLKKEFSGSSIKKDRGYLETLSGRG